MELQTGRGVRMDRISSLYRVDLLDCVSAESRARRGNMLQNTFFFFTKREDRGEAYLNESGTECRSAVF